MIFSAYVKSSTLLLVPEWKPAFVTIDGTKLPRSWFGVSALKAYRDYFLQPDDIL